jgi:hypothetical protein
MPGIADGNHIDDFLSFLFLFYSISAGFCACCRSGSRTDTYIVAQRQRPDSDSGDLRARRMTVASPSPSSWDCHSFPSSPEFSKIITTFSFTFYSCLQVVDMGSMRSLRRFVLACLAWSPAIVHAAIDTSRVSRASQVAAMARQARFQRTGSLAKSQDEPDDGSDYTCTASKPCA